MLVNKTYYVKTEEKEHTVKIQNKDEKFYGYDAELVENPTGTLVEKTIIENGEYLPASDNADGYSKVTVEVPSSGLPTLFAPIITAGVNTVSWANDTRNGGFTVTLSATVDGVAVTSPLTITEEMDGKKLIVTASAENFESANDEFVLSYTVLGQSSLKINSEAATMPSIEWLVLMVSGSGATCSLNGTTGSQGGAVINIFNSQDGTITSDFSITFSQNATCYLKSYGQYDRSTSWITGFVISGSPAISKTTRWINKITGTVTVYDNTAENIIKTIPFAIASYQNSDPLGNFSGVAGHTYTFIVNAIIATR